MNPRVAYALIALFSLPPLVVVALNVLDRLQVIHIDARTLNVLSAGVCLTNAELVFITVTRFRSRP